MGHKFDGDWSCFKVVFDDHLYHQLESIGKMHLEFNPNGELRDGTLTYDEEEEPIHLTGKADSGFGPRTIQLESEEYDFFEGILTYESDNRENLAVTGKLHFPDGESRLKLRTKRDKEKVQDDPPWVITKP